MFLWIAIFFLFLSIYKKKNIISVFFFSFLAPPSSIEIVGHTTNSKIEIKENEELEIECLVKNSKPAAKIVWYKGHNELKPGKSEFWKIKNDHLNETYGHSYFKANSV